MKVILHSDDFGLDKEWRQHEYDDIIELATRLRASGKHEIVNWNQV